LRFWLGWLVIACVLPAWMATALTIARSYQREKATLQAGTLATTRALAQAVDNELHSLQTAGEALATSPQLAAGDFAAFHAQAEAVARQLSIINVVVITSSGEQRLNTRIPLGGQLPRGDGAPGNLRSVFSTGKPIISDLFVGPVIGKPVVAVVVPVRLDGRIAYGMGLTLATERLGEILQRQHIPEDWIAAIIDSQGTIVARTRAAERWVGHKADTTLLRLIAQAPEGAAEAGTLDGETVQASFSRSSLSGWSVAIGVPDPGASLRRSLWLTAGIAGALLVAALVFARFISRRIAGSIEALREPALALGSDRAITVRDGTIAEVNEIGVALVTASELLHRRQMEREDALRAEARMSAEKRTAEEASRAKSEFLAMMSHEIRTPMNAVVGYARLLADAPIEATYQAYAKIIDSSAGALLTVIDDILDFSRIEAGKLTVEPVALDLREIVAQGITLIQAVAAAKGLALVQQPAEAAEPVWVRADPGRLRQVLINLLGNAVKFSERGTITISTEKLADGRGRVAVADQGIGMAPDRLERLFESFSQLDSTIGRRFGGTGLGLAISRRLVDLMGGVITVESALGRGSRFIVTLPAAPAPAARAAPPAPAAVVASAPAHILVVDDLETNRKLIQAYLEHQGHHLTFASTGGEGVQLATAVPFDLILMDVNMPGMDGLEATQRIRQSGGPNAEVPIVALTASAMPEEAARCLAAGMSDHLAKPVGLKDLIQAVATWAGPRTADRG
jgi:signal transduction histidine kinase/ActR/RegA family two-component response regulator